MHGNSKCKEFDVGAMPDSFKNSKEAESLKQNKQGKMVGEASE